MVNKVPGMKTNEDIHKSLGAKKEAGEGNMRGRKRCIETDREVKIQRKNIQGVWGVGERNIHKRKLENRKEV